eukprot:jgi/Orpsp1_1/1179944/evm.model.c7180000071484.1
MMISLMLTTMVSLMVLYGHYSTTIQDLKAGQHSLGDIDFVLCIGDGKTDEPVFSLFNGYNANDYYTATVGKKQTEAKFYINDVTEVQNLLNELIALPK